MPLARDDAVCLRSTPFGETSQVVSILCRERGRVRLLVKGARRRTKLGKSKFDGGIEPLDLGHALFAHVPERELSLMTEWKLLDRHRHLRRSLRTVHLASYAAELVDRLIEQHEPVPKLFDGFQRFIARLEDRQKREAVTLAFVLNLIRQAGILPDLSRAADGASIVQALRDGETITFSPSDAALHVGQDVPGDVEVVDSDGLAAVLALLRLPRTGAELPVLSRRVASGAHRLLVSHVRHQTDARVRTARALTSSI
ncbi:MAG: DNA repair protein RecO [Planctomycetota bacterium]